MGYIAFTGIVSAYFIVSGLIYLSLTEHAKITLKTWVNSL